MKSRTSLILLMSIVFFLARPETIYAGSPHDPKPGIDEDVKPKIVPTGTGNTTGHIANLSITNDGPAALIVLPQVVYIPSSGLYQTYVGRIPETIVPPGTLTISIQGYCADVHKPPVPLGTELPLIQNWIAIPAPLENKDPKAEFIILVENTVTPFSAADVPGIIVSPGFTARPDPISTTPAPTWPGSDTPIGGLIDPDKHPEAFAPMIIDALIHISESYDRLKAEDKMQTPFSVDSVKERDAVIQHTFWIFMAEVTGEKYQKKHFTDNVLEQFELKTGTTIVPITEPQRKELESGVDQFWKVFTAVGLEAKVMSSAENSTKENKD